MPFSVIAFPPFLPKNLFPSSSISISVTSKVKDSFPEAFEKAKRK